MSSCPNENTCAIENKDMPQGGYSSAEATVACVDGLVSASHDKKLLMPIDN